MLLPEPCIKVLFIIAKIKQGGFADSVAISDSFSIRVKFEKIRIIKIVWKWTLKGFEEDSFGQNDL
jgi:hypothetical protein